MRRVFILLFLFAFYTNANSINIDGIYYNLNPNTQTAEVTYVSTFENSNKSAYIGDVIIPPIVSYNDVNYIVKSIGKYAFNNCTDLKSISIPNTISEIGSEAFWYCPNLRSVVIGNGISRIEDYVFSGSTHLTSFTVGSNVSYISKYAFCQKYDAYYPSYSKPIKTIWLTNTPPSGYLNAEGTVNYVSNELYTSLKTKKNYPFLSSIFEVGGIKYVPVSPSEKKCDAIDCLYDASAKSITLTPNVSYRGIDMDLVEIMPYLCCNNQHIVDVQWNVVNDIPNNSFQSCKSLKNFIIGDYITSIGVSALSDCISLVDFVIPTSVKKIEGGALSGCSSLTSITIPQSVTTIKNNVFNGCTSIKSVIIQDRDTPLEIGTSNYNPQFYSCPLDTVFIGGRITYSDEYNYDYPPFAKSTTLRSVAIADKETYIYKKEFYNCTNLQNVWIGDGVTTIDEWAFSGCKSLKFFSFGSKLNSIGKEAFSDCVSISIIISKAATPPVCGYQALDDINKWDCKLIVPMGSIELYQTSDQWKEFFFIEETSNIKSVIYGDGQYNGLNRIYNLKGQKMPYIENLRQLPKGFYIINGDKVIKK